MGIGSSSWSDWKEPIKKKSLEKNENSKNVIQNTRLSPERKSPMKIREPLHWPKNRSISP